MTVYVKLFEGRNLHPYLRIKLASFYRGQVIKRIFSFPFTCNFGPERTVIINIKLEFTLRKLIVPYKFRD